MLAARRGMNYITANQLAGSDPNDQKSFRRELRKAEFVWHNKHDKWTAMEPSDQSQAMRRVYEEWIKRTR